MWNQIRSRHPLEIFELLVCLIIGLLVLTGHVSSNGITATLLPWQQFIWGLGLALGGAICLLSIVKFSPPKALILEQVGLAMLSPAALLYAACALLYNGLGAGLAAAFVGSFGLFCSFRYFQIQALFNRAERGARSGD